MEFRRSFGGLALKPGVPNCRIGIIVAHFNPLVGICFDNPSRQYCISIEIDAWSEMKLSPLEVYI